MSIVIDSEIWIQIDTRYLGCPIVHKITESVMRSDLKWQDLFILIPYLLSKESEFLYYNFVQLYNEYEW